LENFTSSKGCELRNIALKSEATYDYSKLGLEMTMTFSLKGESSFWIFLRCPDEEVCDKHNAIVKVSKEDKSQKCFISLAIFSEDEKSFLNYKTFVKRQLINFSSKYLLILIIEFKSHFFIENDMCNLKLNIVDIGNEKLNIKVYGID
jgi:hypothetical protein